MDDDQHLQMPNIFIVDSYAGVRTTNIGEARMLVG